MSAAHTDRRSQSTPSMGGNAARRGVDGSTGGLLRSFPRAAVRAFNARMRAADALLFALPETAPAPNPNTPATQHRIPPFRGGGRCRGGARRVLYPHATVLHPRTGPDPVTRSMISGNRAYTINTKTAMR